MATITITRDSGYADAVRSYAVVLDGKPIGKLATGESASYAVSPGSHTLCMTIDWCRSKEVPFSVAQGETIRFTVGSALRGLKLFLAIWYVLFERDGYLVLERST